MIGVPPGSAAPSSGAIHPAPPSVNCDLCGWPMPVPAICVERREIIGLLTCSQCVEDALDARAFEPRAEVGMNHAG